MPFFPPRLAGLLRACLAGAGTLALTVAGAEPGEHARPFLQRDVLLGDLGGARSALEARGVTLALQYAQEYLGDVAGGRRRAGESNGLLELDLDLDLEKLAGWQGGLVHAVGFAGWGHSLSGRWIGDDSTVSNIYIRNGTRLFEAYLQQSFGTLCSVRAGLLGTDTEFYSSSADFTHSAGGSLFINSDFGAIPILSFNVPEPIFPYAGPGVSLTVTPAQAVTLRAAIYDGVAVPVDDLDDRNPHGFEPRLATTDGALLLAEVEYHVNKPPVPDEHAPTAANDGPRRLGGSYRLGGFYHTGTFPDWASGRAVRGLGGGWVTADQMLWRENGRGDQGLSAFARISAAPRDRSVLELGLDAGLHYFGLLPGREEDSLGLGVSVKRYSRDYDRAERRAGRAPRDHETIVELTYRAPLTPWLALQPDVQWVIHPAGDPAAEDALVAGLRAAITF